MYAYWKPYCDSTVYGIYNIGPCMMSVDTFKRGVVTAFDTELDEYFFCSVFGKLPQTTEKTIGKAVGPCAENDTHYFAVSKSLGVCVQ